MEIGQDNYIQVCKKFHLKLPSYRPDFAKNGRISRTKGNNSEGIG